GGAFAAGDDRASMAHAASGGRGPSGNKADDRLLEIRADPRRRLFLGRAADLADHDNGVRLIVLGEELDRIDEAGANDRVATNTDGCRLTESGIGELLHRLVGQRARARNNPDTARLVDKARHDADLRLAGRNDAGA